VELGLSPQLPLEAAIAEAGGFAGVAAATVTELGFWHLTGRDPVGRIVPVGETPADLRKRIDEARTGLAELVARFDDPETPYRAVPRPDRGPRFNDYELLSRFKEWSVAPEGEDIL